tara:strand:- start:559 stop:1611 length:1053 start_codon:yes stop_codon:yes gene_type:complete
MDIATIGDIVNMATSTQKKAFPRRYTYNNSQWSRQLGFAYSGGNKLLGGFLIPPGHTLFSTRSSLTLIGKDAVDDDLQGSIGSVILSIPLDYYPTGGSGENEPSNFPLNDIDDLESWVQERLPYCVTADEQADDRSVFSMMAEHGQPDDSAFHLGPGSLILNGYGRGSYDSAKVLFSRQRKTHPIFGTGMMIGAQSVSSSSGSGNSDGGVYTPVDHSQTVIKRNVVADESPVLVVCMIYMPHQEDNVSMSAMFPDLDIDGNSYKEWINIHDPYLVDENLRGSSTWTGGTAQGGFKFITGKYSDEDTDQGVPEESSTSKWNCTWRYSAQISPTRHPGEAPRNVTANNMYRR